MVGGSDMDVFLDNLVQNFLEHWEVGPNLEASGSEGRIRGQGILSRPVLDSCLLECTCSLSLSWLSASVRERVNSEARGSV